jgi:Winged helix DNA-binding domain
VEWADLKFIRDEVHPSDSALSKQLTTLEEAGYVEIRKSFVGKRPRPSARLSKARPRRTRRPQHPRHLACHARRGRDCPGWPERGHASRSGQTDARFCLLPTRGQLFG